MTMYAVPLAPGFTDALLVEWGEFGPITGESDKCLTCAHIGFGALAAMRTVGYLIRLEGTSFYHYGVVVGTGGGWAPVLEDGQNGTATAVHVAAHQAFFSPSPEMALRRAGIIKEGSMRIVQ